MPPPIPELDPVMMATFLSMACRYYYWTYVVWRRRRRRKCKLEMRLRTARCQGSYVFRYISIRRDQATLFVFTRTVDAHVNIPMRGSKSTRTWVWTGQTRTGEITRLAPCPNTNNVRCSTQYVQEWTLGQFCAFISSCKHHSCYNFPL